jgi:2-polyprenyl-6-methoxyphenol hydroxylase-like FAD-dependent oxidoreductase
MKSDSYRKQAVIIGGSVAGLLAARVLADYFQSVLIIERDDISHEGEHRRGVPHGRHAHALLAGGQQAIEKLLPGISSDLIDSGAIETDPLNDGTWFFEGGAFRKTSSGITGVLVSRLGLESSIRERVRSLPNVEVVDGHAVRGLLTSADKTRVIGVQLDDRSIGADLVVDAGGRGSQSPAWLESIGYEAPREEKVEIQLAYTTRLFRYVPGSLGDNNFIVIAPTPSGKRGGVIARQEADRFIATLFGHFGEQADSDLNGFGDFAKSLPSPLIYNAIRKAEPIGDAATFRFPANTRRRYERLKRFPEGYLAFGDSICSFDPIYGQGMSVAALEAIALHNVMRGGDKDLARRYFSKAATVIDNPWQIAVGGDLRMPETVGKRSLAVRLINRYISRVHKRAHVDTNIGLAFIRVAQLIDEPASLFRPRVLLSVLRRSRSRPERAMDDLLTITDPANRLEA